MPGEFAAKSIPIDRLTYYVLWDSTAILGVPMKIVSTVVVIFVLFGNVLFKSGGAAFFTDISMALMGRHRGGPAKIAIVGSSLFGTISGNVVSNVHDRRRGDHPDDASRRLSPASRGCDRSLRLDRRAD